MSYYMIIRILKFLVAIFLTIITYIIRKKYPLANIVTNG